MSDEETVVESVIQRPDHAESTTDRTDGASLKRKNSIADDEQDDVGKRKRRIDRGVAGAEEKRRGQRLFGSLLGTLGEFRQDSNSERVKERAARQADVEKRQKERLKKAADDIAARQAETEAARSIELLEQERQFERQRVEAQLAHKLVLAGFLSTSTASGPGLLYLPWKLTEAQEETIDGQVKAAKLHQEEVLASLRPQVTNAEREGGSQDQEMQVFDAVEAEAEVEEGAPAQIDNMTPVAVDQLQEEQQQQAKEDGEEEAPAEEP